MRKILMAATILAAAASLTGCYTPQERALGGAALGGLGGAGIGALASGGSTVGTLGGAAVGAAAGGLLGAATAPPPPPAYAYGAPPPRGPRCAHWGWDYNGNRVCQGYY